VTFLDGSEVFCTKSKRWSCEKCRITERTKEDGTKEIKYHDDIVGAAYVGRRHNRCTDIITLDSLYAKAPIINEITDQNMIAVIRVKQQNYHIIRDAEGLFPGLEPDLSTTLSLNSSW